MMILNNFKKDKNIIDSLDLDAFCDSALSIGEMIVSSGGEISRCENTIKRLAYAYGVDEVSVIAVTSFMVATMKKGNKTVTHIKRIENRGYDFYKLKSANAISREICNHPVNVCEIDKKILAVEESDKINVFSKKIIAWCMASSFFTGFFGGNLFDMVFSAILGVIICFLLRLLNKYKVNNYFTIVIVSLFGGYLSRLLTLTDLNIHTSAINAGNIMLLIPGLALINSLRDMLSKDTISGILETVETVIVSLTIAVGFALTTYNIDVYVEPEYIVYLICAFFASSAFAIFINQSFKDGLLAALISTIGWAIVLILKDIFHIELIGYMVASMFITLMSEILARTRKCPATVFLIQGIVLLVPGASLYRTMFYFVSNNISKCLAQGLITFKIAISISVGILIMTAVADIYTEVRKNKK